MDQRKRKIATALLAAASITALAAPAHAIVYAEGPADAGQTLATAQNTGTNNTTALTAITGTFAGLNDADLYRITITTLSSFSATTNNAATNTGGQDTALFLFNSTGVPIATNDDANGFTLNSALAAGNALYATLAAGTYFLGISESGNEPVNSASQLLFNGYPGGDTTATRGAASGLNPTTLSNFNSNSFGGNNGGYQIDLTSVATATSVVPEPRTWASLGLGAAAAFAFLRRRRQA